jgi:hypothetical protein
VTLDLAKYAYAMFVDWDAALYDDRTDTPAHTAKCAPRCFVVR